MTLQELIDRVRAQIDEPDEQGFFTNEEITDSLNEGQEQVALITKVNRARAEMELTEAGKAWELPPGFIKEFKVLYNDNPLKRVEFEEEERGYYFWGEELHLNFEGEGGKLEVYYAKSPEPLVNMEDELQIPLRLNSLLINYAIYRLKMKDEKYNEAQVYKQEYVEGLEIILRRQNKLPRKTTFTVERR